MRKLSKNFILVFCVALLGTNSVYAIEDIDVPVPSYQTDLLLESGLEGFTGECLDYCVTGICVRLVIGWFTYKIILTPKVVHNVPDFVVNSYDEPGEEPWEEWRETVSEATQEMQNLIMQLITVFPVGGGKINSPEHDKTGDEGDERFKEIDIIGHPMTYFNNALAGKNSTQLSLEEFMNICRAFIGSKSQCEQMADDMGLGGFKNGTDEGTVGGAFENFGNNSFKSDYFDNKQITEGLGMEDAFSTMDQMAGSMETMERVQEVGNMVGGGMGVEVAIDHYFCKTDTVGFMPYYLTQIDSYWWREIIPMGTDLDYALRYAKCSIIALDGSCIVGANEAKIWGVIYPRHGTVIQNNDYKASAVMATRAIDVLLDPDSYLRFRMPAEAKGRNGVWQKIFPEVDTCEYSLEARRKGYASIYVDDLDLSKPDSDKDTHEFGNHAWAYWRPYTCCLSERGSKIGEVNIGAICLNDM